ncbi:MAG TPA: hypothetical protein VGW31_10370 [Hanamia sp.]|nr:hypothetical protein [Hanamia sp.]
MEKVQILAVGRDPVVLQKLLRFINENPKWEGTGTVDDESAIIIFNQRKFEVILFIDHLSEESEKKLRSVFTFHDPSIIFMQHSGDSTALLASEIQEALDDRKAKLNIMDDVFKEKKPEL